MRNRTSCLLILALCLVVPAALHAQAIQITNDQGHTASLNPEQIGGRRGHHAR